MWVYWVPKLGFESVVVALVILKVFEEARAERGTPRVLVVLLRDSLAYFSVILINLIANLLVWTLARVGHLFSRFEKAF